MKETEEMRRLFGQALIATDPFASMGEKRPGAVGASTNTFQPVLVFRC